MRITMELLAYDLSLRGFSVTCRNLNGQAVRHISLDREPHPGSVRVCVANDIAGDGMYIAVGQPLKDNAVPCIYITERAELPTVLAEARDTMAKYEGWGSRLLETAILGRDCQELSDMAQEVTDSHLFVYDGLLRLSAYRCEISPDWDGYFTRIGNELYIGPKTLQIARENGIFEDVKKHADAYVFHKADVTAVTACIRSRSGLYLGYLFMTPEEEYARAMLPVADHLAACIAIRWQTAAALPPTDEIGFPANVLQGVHIAPQQLEHMLSIQNWNIHDPYQVLVMRSDGGQDYLPYYRYLLLSVPTDKRIVILNRSLVIVQHDSFIIDQDDEALKYYSSLLRETNMICGVSNIAGGFDRIHDLYCQAAMVFEMPGRKGQLRFYHDCLCEDVMRSFGKEHSFEIAIHPSVQKLAAHCSPADLLDTLYAYLVCSGNYDACCRRLFIHRSTLKYRIAKIRELCGESCFDPDNRLNILLSIQMARTNGSGD